MSRTIYTHERNPELAAKGIGFATCRSTSLLFAENGEAPTCPACLAKQNYRSNPELVRAERRRRQEVPWHVATPR